MDQTFTLTLTQAQLNIINQAIMLAPYGQVATIVREINQQIQEQLAAVASQKETP